MKIVYNPTAEDITIQILGNTYAILAGERKLLPENIAENWNKVHEFLIVTDPVSNEISEDKQGESDVKESDTEVDSTNSDDSDESSEEKPKSKSSKK